MGAQHYSYMQQSAPQMSAGAQHSLAAYQNAYPGSVTAPYAGQLGQLGGAAPVAAQQPVSSQYYGQGFYS
jgi:hypothetical protein